MNWPPIGRYAFAFALILLASLIGMMIAAQMLLERAMDAEDVKMRRVMIKRLSTLCGTSGTAAACPP